MGLKTIALISVFPVLALAENTALKQPVEILNETQQTMKSLSGVDPACFVCQFAMAPESGNEGQSEPCDDLFGAACTKADGKSKYQDRSKTLPQELAQFIREARDKTARTMGFKDFDEALKFKIKEAGLDLKEPVDPEAWKNLKREDGSYSLGGNSQMLYGSAEQCNNEVKELQGIQYYNVTDIQQLREAAQKFDRFLAKYREMSIHFYAKDIPTFMTSHVASKCSTLKLNPSSYKPEENPEVAKACENFLQIKKQAVHLFRMEGTPQYQAQAEKFVRENLLPELKYSFSSSLITSAASPPEKSEIEKIREQIQTSQNVVSNYCYSYSSAIENAGSKVFEEFVDDINKSKTTVDTVIDSFYGDGKKKLATQMFQKARGSIQSLVSRFVKDPAKRGEILDGYDRLKMFWMEKPDESAYKKKSTGLVVLDEEKATPAFIRVFADDVFAAFSDPSLSFFTALNADYMPPVSFGTFKNVERVSMMPAFIHSLDKNPYAFLSVIAHEAGHKIGPQVSKINGYDLASEYRELLACYKDSKSINMQEQQADEVIADYISSEVLAEQISILPKEKRKQALMSSAEAFCIFDDASNHSQSMTCKGTHPESSLRVSGIYGANPNLRRVIGCEGESAKFKTCGLNSSVANGLSTAAGSDGGVQ